MAEIPFTLWRTSCYCMACDRPVRQSDDECPHCGVVFADSEKTLTRQEGTPS